MQDFVHQQYPQHRVFLIRILSCFKSQLQHDETITMSKHSACRGFDFEVLSPKQLKDIERSASELCFARGGYTLNPKPLRVFREVL